MAALALHNRVGAELAFEVANVCDFDVQAIELGGGGEHVRKGLNLRWCAR